MRRTLFLLTCAVATALSTSFASATMLITADRGGRIIDYVARFLEARASGEQVVIDGACLSACTLVVGVLPRGQVCATPKAVLGFHAAWRPTADGGRIGSYAATRAIPSVMADPVLGPPMEPGEIAAANIPVPAPYAALAEFTEFRA